MIYLTMSELLRISERVLAGRVEVRDHGLLESALARPRTTVGGNDAYGSLEEKAAALLHSLARNHALVDGNKRLALAATIAFLGINGRRLTFSNDDVYDLVISVAAGGLDDVHDIAFRIRNASERSPVDGRGRESSS
ncbi:MAG TPA: type II toxin-antitoxin system death-on-curing family toxin [Acidothermaceae bacterium]|jgi:death-on-curing protein